MFVKIKSLLSALMVYSVLCLFCTAVPTQRSLVEEENMMHPRPIETLRRNLQPRTAEATQQYWLELSKQLIREKSQQKRNTNVAKNIILFLGDGMGLATLAAARNYIGDESTKLSFEDFPFTGLSKTYSVDKIVPDSACTSTSYLCGVKANYGTIGVNAHVKRGDCDAMRDDSNHVYSLGKWAMDAGKAAGLVTTTRVTHASPAGVYAHTADREWENDSLLETDCGAGLDDIALQLIHGPVGKKLKVVLGGGKRNFYGPDSYKKGRRNDRRNLVEEFQAMDAGNVFVKSQKKLLKVDPKKTKRLLGLFSSSHMHYHLEALDNSENDEPTLAEMTQKAIEVLQTEKQGYFLFIEGGKIDKAHHGTMARMALDETAELSKAVALAREMTSEDDTLIVVTADHSHAFSLAGYQERGSDIFSESTYEGLDGKPYMALSYANGRGFHKFFDTSNNARVDPSSVLTGDKEDEFPATVPLDIETHGGEDVAVFASGPWAHLFTGVYEQNAIPHIMAYAACIGDGLRSCD